MTIKEFMAKAKAVGGWTITRDGYIENKNIKSYVVGACPLQVVFGRDCYIDAADAVGLPSSAIIVAADNCKSSIYFDPELRAEMESWCK